MRLQPHKIFLGTLLFSFLLPFGGIASKGENSEIDFQLSLPVTGIQGDFARHLASRNQTITRATCVLDVQPSGLMLVNPDGVILNVDNQTILVQAYVFIHYGEEFPKDFYGSTDFQRSSYPLADNWRQEGWPEFRRFPGGSSVRRAQYVDGVLRIERRHDRDMRSVWAITVTPDLKEMSRVQMRSYRRTDDGREVLEDEVVCANPPLA